MNLKSEKLLIIETEASKNSKPQMFYAKNGQTNR